MNKIEQIKKAIENANNGVSKLTPEVMAIGGYTSNKIRHLLNNLGSISENYFEIGCHRGSTFCAATFENYNLKEAVGCDNYSELNEDNPKDDFVNNAIRFTKFKWPLWVIDAFIIPDLHFIPDLYLYDGNHAEWAQKKALTYFYKWLPNEFIFCADDYQWQDVKKGTKDGIKEMGLEILFEQELGMETESNSNEYWNGFYVALLKKST